MTVKSLDSKDGKVTLIIQTVGEKIILLLSTNHDGPGSSTDVTIWGDFDPDEVEEAFKAVRK